MSIALLFRRVDIHVYQCYIIHLTLPSSSANACHSVHTDGLHKKFIPSLPSNLDLDRPRSYTHCYFEKRSMSREKNIPALGTSGDTEPPETPECSSMPIEGCPSPSSRRTTSPIYRRIHGQLSEMWITQEENGMASPLAEYGDVSKESDTEWEFPLPPNDIGDSYLFTRFG